jgi:hypothetical protein
LVEADPENPLAKLLLTRIDRLVQIFNSLTLSSDDAVQLRQATIEIAEIIKDAMAFQARQAVLTPEQVAEIERNAHVKAGIKSGEARNEKLEDRNSYETELAKAIRAEHDDYSQKRLARAMLRRAKLDGKKLSAERTLILHIREREREGVLPPRRKDLFRSLRAVRKKPIQKKIR